MKNKIRTLQATMAACLLGASLLAGCAAPASSGDDAPAEAEEVEDVSDEATDEATDEAVEEVEIDPASITSDFPVGEHVDLDQVLYDENGLKVTATGFGPVLYYAALNVDIQNTGDQDMQIWLEKSSLNGWVWDASLVSLDDGRFDEGLELILKPGETKSCGIGFSNTFYLEPCNIQGFKQIGFVLAGYNPESGDTLAVTHELIVDLPGTEGIEQAYDDSGNVVYDEGGIRIITKGIVDYGLDSPTAPVYVENLSDRNILVSVNSQVVNGTPTSEDELTQIAEVPAGKHALSELWVNDLTMDSKIEVSFRVVEFDPVTSEELNEIATTEVTTIG